MNLATKEKEEASKLVGSTERKEKDKKKHKEKGSNLTPKGSREFSTCFITFQKQLKRAARKWDSEFQASKSETK